MSRAPGVPPAGRGTPVTFAPLDAALGAALAVTAAWAWLAVVRDASSMSMPDAAPSLAAGAAYTVQWGVMMAAMMLPSAAPMLLLYRTVGGRLSAQGDRVAPPALFATVYLLVWLLLGVPVYAAHVAVAAATARWPEAEAAVPYAVAVVLATAGAYQLTAAKRACLRHCEAPLAFLMRRWRSGYAATLRLALAHAGYCVGCCWGLMVILVAAGVMSLPWVLAITVVVFAEKVLPGGQRTAQVVGAALLALAIAVALRPGLAVTMRGQTAHAGAMDMGHGAAPR